MGDSWCRTRSWNLRSGVQVGVTELAFEGAFSFVSEQPSAELELTASRGDRLATFAPDGQDLGRGGGMLQLGRCRRRQSLVVTPGVDTQLQCVSLSLSAGRLRELLGVHELPAVFRDLFDSPVNSPLLSRAMTPPLFRVLDELLGADGRGKGRLLWQEAKSLELLALITDELAESAAGAAKPCARDVERLQRARSSLLSNLAEPPSLAELARSAGFSETKLKVAFRTLFGSSVFAYLRTCRLEHAHRLLLERQLNVTEVAERVGYANPGKFAAAFRKHFGLRPSDI